MKVLLINGSPHREGNTFIALNEVARTLEAEGVEAEIVSIGTKPIPGCIGCWQCAQTGSCAFNDDLYLLIREKLATADALIDRLTAAGYDVATRLTPAATFWPAEAYHQDYYDRRGVTPACHLRVKRF